MSKIAITGGAGFVGSHLVDNLVDENEVHVIDDLSGGFKCNINPKAIFHQMSVVNARQMEWLFSDYKFDYVFHLAAYAAEGLSHFIRRFNYTNNVIGSVNIINGCVKNDVKAICFFSSAAVYGHINPPMKETDIPHPADPYGVAKLAIEMDLTTACNMFGLNYVIFRPYNLYGIRQNLSDRYRNLIGVFINQAMSGKPLSIFGDGLQTRAFTLINDIVPLIAQSIKNEKAYNNIFNIGSMTQYTVKDVSEIIKSCFHEDYDIVNLEERNEVKHVFCETTKVRDFLGEYSETPIEKGISDMVEWAKGVEIQELKYFNNIEITKNLPKSWVKDN